MYLWGRDLRLLLIEKPKRGDIMEKNHLENNLTMDEYYSI